MELRKLKIGRRYWVTHRRKGTFEGVVVGIEKTEPGDSQDDFVITMDMNTADDASPRLRRAKGAMITRTNIRPSLIIRIEPYQPRPKRKAKPESKESFGDKLKGVFGFRR